MKQYTIDSLINKYKAKAKNAKQSINRMEYYNEKEYEQIIEYLEELKKYRSKDIPKVENNTEIYMDKVYLIGYSTEEGTYTSHIAFATQDLAEEKCIELMEKDGLDWYTVDVPFVNK